MHPPKWFVYACIAGFTMLLAVFIAWQFAAQNSAYNKVVAKQKQQQAKQYKAVADSVAKQVVVALDSIAKDKAHDSLVYLHEKESLRANYLTKVKKYEAKMLAIDTMPDVQIDSSFSIREMLSGN